VSNAGILDIDVEQVALYLDSDLSPDDCMGLSDLDGFLIGTVVGQELIMPTEWRPMVWGDKDPEFESTAHADVRNYTSALSSAAENIWSFAMSQGHRSDHRQGGVIF